MDATSNNATTFKVKGSAQAIETINVSYLLNGKA